MSTGAQTTSRRHRAPWRSGRRVIGVALLAVLVPAFLSAPVFAKKKEKPRPAAVAVANGDTSEVLFRIGSQTITRADVQRRLDELPEGVRGNFTTPEGRQNLLDRMVEERVWLSVAEGEGVPERPKIQQQLVQQRRDLIIRTYLTEMMAAHPAPGDSELKVYYDAHVEEYKVPATVSVRHIQTKTRAQAVQVLQLARAKQDWNKLCMRYSTDTLSRGTGGNLGSVTHDGQFAILGRQPALAESAFALGGKALGGPYKSDRGWHVLKTDELKADDVRSFDQMRGAIQRQLGTQRSQDFYRDRLEQARKHLGVTPDSSAIKRYVSQKKDARELFKDAQEKGSPEERIAAYKQVLDVYPDSDVSAQAAFMLGFIYSEEIKNYDEAEKAFRTLLTRYPASELAPSAQWMVDHMRTEEAPAFIQTAADSIKTSPEPTKASRTPASKP
jgi:peptidyl-prolyl cis-trans isomerase C